MPPRKPSSRNRGEPSKRVFAQSKSSNPFDRQRSFLKQRYAVLRPTDENVNDTTDASTLGAVVTEEAAEPSDLTTPESSARTLPPNFRRRVTEAYRKRQQQRQQRDSAPSNFDSASAEAIIERDATLSAPANRWIPIGPFVLRQGQAVNRPATSGRVAGLAVAPGGRRIYVASANGGVWRSDDGGHTWRSTMDAWDLNPTTKASDSLACGAIAIDMNDPDRVYVGTGEGGGEAYFGVGPVRSDDGGKNWITEATAPGAPVLEGSGFYRLAVDPANRERVLGAAEVGLYRREPNREGLYHWVRKQSGDFSSVVVARSSSNVTTFYAAKREGNVLMSNDGHAWTTVGANFPTDDVGRIGLAVQPNNPNVVYALISRLSDSHVLGVWRLDRGDDRWRKVKGTPADLFGDDPADEGQGWYDLAIAVDPNNINRIYLGGAAKDVEDLWPSSIYSCLVTSSGAGANLSYRMIAKYIGANVHADIHALEFTPNDSDQLWVGCDGGVFHTGDATGAASFAARNVGLSTLMMNHLTLHPTEEAVLFCGTQDNGTSRYTGEEVWLHSAWGDGGYVVVNWHDPYKVLRTYICGDIQRAKDGGASYDSWMDASLPQQHLGRGEFYAPLVGTPPNADAPEEAELVAFGGRRLWLSTNFGSTWRSLPTNDTNIVDDHSPDALPQPEDGVVANNFLSLVFASGKRLYAGTTIGEVYLFNKSGAKWTRKKINAAPLPAGGPITDIIVDPADESGDSIYVTLGGHGDYRHVWHFDGQVWQHRSGPASNPDKRLMDIQHNAIAVDTAHPNHLYVGADIGIWRSTDGGRHWDTFSNGLPDAAVLDLKLHKERRLLLAATHGRGVYEYRLDTTTTRAVEIYLRDTQLDTGRRASVEGIDHPTEKGKRVSLGQSPDIKIDAPSKMGAYQTPTNQINFHQFVDLIDDESERVATTDPSVGTAINRVYVQVHNRGLTPALNVRVMLLLAMKSAGKSPRLPPGYAARVRAGHQINTPQWRTISTQTLLEARAGHPPIAAFDLPSNLLPSPADLKGKAEHCLLALLHCPADPFTNSETDVEALSAGERKATFKNLRIVPFKGTLPT